MELDGAYIEERKWGHWKGRFGLEPAGETEERETLTDMEEIGPQEALEEGMSWGEVKKLARNRIRWRRFVDTLCP